jgi:phosphonate transport system permease protein
MTTPELTAPALGRSWRKAATTLLIVVGVAALYWYAWVNTQADLGSLVSGWHNMKELIRRSIPPDTSVLDESIKAAVVTFNTALLGTTIAFFISILLTPLAARNLTPHRIAYEVTRLFIGFFRTIPIWVLGLIFLVAVGLSPFAGVLALAVETVGVLTKLYAEAVEEMDMGPVDALRVSGAGQVQVFLHGVLPSVTPTFVGLLIYRFDSNIRAALFLSVIGAGGLGFLIFQSFELFQYQQVFTEVLVMLVMLLLVERVSILLRMRIH